MISGNDEPIRMAGESLGVDPAEQAAVVCPYGETVDCCRRFPCVGKGIRADHPLPGLDLA